MQRTRQRKGIERPYTNNGRSSNKQLADNAKITSQSRKQLLQMNSSTQALDKTSGLAQAVNKQNRASSSLQKPSRESPELSAYSKRSGSSLTRLRRFAKETVNENEAQTPNPECEEYNEEVARIQREFDHMLIQQRQMIYDEEQIQQIQSENADARNRDSDSFLKEEPRKDDS